MAKAERRAKLSPKAPVKTETEKMASATKDREAVPSPRAAVQETSVKTLQPAAMAMGRKPTSVECTLRANAAQAIAVVESTIRRAASSREGLARKERIACIHIISLQPPRRPRSTTNREQNQPMRNHLRAEEGANPKPRTGRSAAGLQAKPGCAALAPGQPETVRAEHVWPL